MDQQTQNHRRERDLKRLNSENRCLIHVDRFRLLQFRCDNFPDSEGIQFTFLGYTFRPRKAVGKYSRVYVNFSPSVSREALKTMRQTVRGCEGGISSSWATKS
jgi:RNA-directed DNA polymerase